MNVIGLRVSPSEIYYSIVNFEDSKNEILSISSIIVPEALEVPNKLSYLRNIINTILIQYNIIFAGLKTIEGNARTSINNNLTFRINIEGVIMELLSNSTVKDYFIGLSTNIASVLKINKDTPEKMLDQIIDIGTKRTDSNKKISCEYKDALIVAFAAYKSGVRNE